MAPTGRGKTALLIHWLARIQVSTRWRVVFAPISLRYQTADAATVLSTVARGLADCYGERDQLETFNLTPDQFRPIISEYLRRNPSTERGILVVLDGLDEAIVGVLVAISSHV